VAVGVLLLPVIIASGLSSAAQLQEPTPIRIEFDSPPGCSNVDAFYEGVHGRTDRVRRAGEGEKAVQIRVRLFRGGTTTKGELRLSDQSGDTESRKVEGSTCDEVVEALSLTTALALDPSAKLSTRTGPNTTPDSAAATPTDGSASATSSTTAPSLPPTATKPQPPQKTIPVAPFAGGAIQAPSRSERTHVDLAVQAVAATVVTSGISFGGAIGARVILPWQIQGTSSVGLTLLHARNDWLKAADLASVQLTALSLTGCPWRVRANSWLELEPCMTGTGGWLVASGLAVSHRETVGRTWWSAGLSGAASAALVGRFRLELNVGVTVPLIRRKFVTISPDQMVGETPWVATLASAGLAYRF